MPLTARMRAAIDRIQPVAGCDLVFTSERFEGEPINKSAAGEALKALGVDPSLATSHGFRANLVEFAKTYHPADLVTAHWCTHHAPSRDGKTSGGKVDKAYDRDQPVPACGRLWQCWSDFCSGGYANVVPFQTATAA